MEKDEILNKSLFKNQKKQASHQWVKNFSLVVYFKKKLTENIFKYRFDSWTMQGYRCQPSGSQTPSVIFVFKTKKLMNDSPKDRKLKQFE